jgi:anti-sigma factor RsiW
MTTDPAASGPTSGPAGHADPDRLADLADGLLNGETAEELRGHLASCERCAEDFALITLDSGLADFLEPEPIPAEVVARVEAALYREPALPVTATAASSGSSASSRPSTSRSSRLPRSSHSSQRHVDRAAQPSRARRLKFAFGGLGSVALLVGGTYAGLSMVSGGTETAVRSSAGAASKAAPGSPGAVLGAAPGPLAQIEQQATGLLASLKGRNGSGVATDASPPGNVLRTAAPAAGMCWQNPRPTETPLASAPTMYENQPAELLVYAKSGDPAHAHVVVVPAVCTATQSSSVPGLGSAGLSPSGPAPFPLAETDITRP